MKEKLNSPAQKKTSYLAIFGLLAFVFALLSVMAIPGFRPAPERARQRACYANQKILAGAIEMFNLDHKVEVKTINSELLQRLQEEGYLSEAIKDPGGGPESGNRYHLVKDTLFCTHHGSIQGLSGEAGLPPRQELAAARVENQKLLARAQTKFPEEKWQANLGADHILAMISFAFFALFILELCRLACHKIWSTYHYIKTGQE